MEEVTISSRETSKEAKEQGSAFINFTVNEDGSLCHLKIQRSSGYEALDKEALRLVKSMPAWIPGEQDGKTVKVHFTIPINFLYNKNDLTQKQRG